MPPARAAEPHSPTEHDRRGERDRLDLDSGTVGQARHLDERPGRARRGEEVHVLLVGLIPQGDVGNVVRSADHVFESTAYRRQPVGQPVHGRVERGAATGYCNAVGVHRQRS